MRSMVRQARCHGGGHVAGRGGCVKLGWSDIIVKQEGIGVGARAKPLDYRTGCTLGQFGTKPHPLAFPLIVFLADRAIEIANRIIGAIAGDL
jgi:hypothetical protein